MVSPRSWVFKGTGVPDGRHASPTWSASNTTGSTPVTRSSGRSRCCPIPRWSARAISSYGDSAYYTHSGGAGVFNAGTMRWVEAIFGDQPHGISGTATTFVRQVTANVLRAFADGPAAARYPAHDNLDAMHEYAGDRIGAGSNLS